MTLRELEPQDVSAAIADDKAVVIDVREPGEFATERLHGASLHPLSTFDPQRLPVDVSRDVVLHCVVDAILGALGLPDIGQLFPDSDPRWKGQTSDVFLREAVRRMDEVGYRVGNMDVTLVSGSRGALAALRRWGGWAHPRRLTSMHAHACLARR